MKKVLVLMTIILALAANISAGGAKEEYPEDLTLKVTALNGPTGIGMIHLFEDNPELGEGVQSEYVVALAPKALMGDLAKRTIDIAVLPANMPALLHAKDLVCIFWGFFHIYHLFLPGSLPHFHWNKS